VINCLTESPVPWCRSRRVIFAHHSVRDYLHGALKEKLNKWLPKEYTVPGKGDWVWRLKKGLYELVHAGRTGSEELNSHSERRIGCHAEGPRRPREEYLELVAGVFWVDDFVWDKFWEGHRGVSERDR
jgi:hypothetical protein